VVQSFDSIVLAGGSARRMDGADKPLVDVGGRSMIEHVLDAVRGANTIVVVGPRRPAIDGVRWCREIPPGGGPVAALAAGVELITSDVVVVLAADLPDVAPAIPVLLQALDGHDLALLESDGQMNYLAAAWRTSALRARLAGLDTSAGASMRMLVDGTRLVGVADEHGWSTDCDTWADVERARGSRR
jgi:molybdopterin-guanine dinucleotide biosynthesis protein A